MTTQNGGIAREDLDPTADRPCDAFPHGPCGLPFIAVGIGMLSSPVWLRARARKIVYALTDRRAIIWQPRFFGGVAVRNFSAAGLGQMSRVERADGSGDLIFQTYVTGVGDDSRTVRAGFFWIDRVHDVENLVRATLQQPFL